jgi:hypothetical protein
MGWLQQKSTFFEIARNKWPAFEFASKDPKIHVANVRGFALCKI